MSKSKRDVSYELLNALYILTIMENGSVAHKLRRENRVAFSTSGLAEVLGSKWSSYRSRKMRMLSDSHWVDCFRRGNRCYYRLTVSAWINIAERCRFAASDSSILVMFAQDITESVGK